MTLETLIVKAPEFSFHDELIAGLKNLFSTKSIYLVSTSYKRRKYLRQEFNWAQVINPFKPCGLLEDSLIWVDDWPNLMGELFEQFLYQLYSCENKIIFSQTYEAPSWCYKRLSFLDITYREIISENCPYIPLWPNILKGKSLSPQNLKRKYFITVDPKRDCHIGLDICFHSYYMSCSRTHRIIGMNCSELRIRDFIFILESLKRFLINQLRLHWNSLVDYHYANQDRGNSDSENSLSRPTYYWNLITSQWKEGIRTLLWWTGRRQET